MSLPRYFFFQIFKINYYQYHWYNINSTLSHLFHQPQSKWNHTKIKSFFSEIGCRHQWGCQHQLNNNVTDTKGTLQCTKQPRDLQDFPETYRRTFGLFVVYVHCNRIKKAVDILSHRRAATTWRSCIQFTCLQTMSPNTILIITSHLCLTKDYASASKVVSFPQISSLKFCKHFYSPPYIFYAPPARPPWYNHPNT
jgi:hypothetical protein